MMRITAYADRLIDDLDVLEWTDSIKTMQRNWIGRSHGRADRLRRPRPARSRCSRPGPTRCSAPRSWCWRPSTRWSPALTGRRRAPRPCSQLPSARPQARKDIDRQDENREKTGVFTGSYATNPVNGQDIPVWIADYVLMGYGTGAIMAVPCGDERDFEFARVFGLDIPAIQRPPDEWFAEHGIAPTLDTDRWPEAFVGEAPYVNSANDGVDLNGMTSVADGIATINEWLEANGRRRGDDHLQAARLAVQPPALLGRAVPDRLRRRRQPARPARRRAAR